MTTKPMYLYQLVAVVPTIHRVPENVHDILVKTRRSFPSAVHVETIVLTTDAARRKYGKKIAEIKDDGSCRTKKKGVTKAKYVDAVDIQQVNLLLLCKNGRFIRDFDLDIPFDGSAGMYRELFSLIQDAKKIEETKAASIGASTAAELTMATA